MSVDGTSTWWDEHAACQYSPLPNAWFEVEDAYEEKRPVDHELVAWARQLCESCVCREECLKRGEGQFGIWGGKTAEERGVNRGRNGYRPAFPRR